MLAGGRRRGRQQQAAFGWPDRQPDFGGWRSGRRFVGWFLCLGHQMQRGSGDRPRRFLVATVLAAPEPHPSRQPVASAPSAAGFCGGFEPFELSPPDASPEFEPFGSVSSDFIVIGIAGGRLLALAVTNVFVLLVILAHFFGGDFGHGPIDEVGVIGQKVLKLRLGRPLEAGSRRVGDRQGFAVLLEEGFQLRIARFGNVFDELLDRHAQDLGFGASIELLKIFPARGW